MKSEQIAELEAMWLALFRDPSVPLEKLYLGILLDNNHHKMNFSSAFQAFLYNFHFSKRIRKKKHNSRC